MLNDFPKQIKSERLVMRFLQESDAARLFRLINENREFIGRHLDWVNNVKTLADEEKYVKQRMERIKAKAGFDWTIETKAGDFIGYIGTDPVTVELYEQGLSIDYENKIVSFAYFMAPKYTGNGYMTEALRALINIARDLGFRRVQFCPEPENKKSIAVMKRCGMQYDSTGDTYFIDLQNSPKSLDSPTQIRNR